MFNIGPQEILLILIIALVVFGPKRLPELARTMGKSLKEFRRASEGIREEISRHLEDDEDDGFTGTYPIPQTSEPHPGEPNVEAPALPSTSDATDGHHTNGQAAPGTGSAA